MNPCGHRPGALRRVWEEVNKSTASLLLLGLLAAGPATAELYRCMAADGSVRFTDDASACPGARPHEPRGQVQRYDAPAPPRRSAPATRPAPADFDARAAQAELWRQKLEQARQEEQELGREVEQLEQLVTWCNRGGKVLTRDRSGLNQDVSCGSVREEHAGKIRRLGEVQRYLAEGIHEECRRSGCLPGWLR